MTEQTIAHYRLVEKVGEGGMGVVYKARDTRLDRLVALKVLPADKVADPLRKQRFVQEAKAASALNHPNVVAIHDIGSADGVDYIAMEFVAGRSLDRIIPRQGLRLSEALRYSVQIADALAAAHGVAIVHRDLKPANIMVTDTGMVKVLDFGVAKLIEPTPVDQRSTVTIGVGRTVEGHVIGTPAYMSPEQAQGLPVDQRSDIFSFGEVLYEMLAGSAAFRGDTQVSTLAAVLDSEPAPLPDAVPSELRRIVARALRKDPSRRFQTAADLRVALEELREESDSGKLAPAAKATTPSNRMRQVAVLAVLLIAAAGGTWMWFSRAAPATIAADVVQPDLRQLTFDNADSSWASLSPDARLVAYQSDRDHPGRYDIWVQQTSGGNAVRLTTDTGDHRRPAFAGDGTRVYYTSSSPRPGIYEVSALGGEPRLVAADALTAAVSPDGSRLAYTARGQLFSVAAAGGEAVRLAEGFSIISPNLVWFYDSARLAIFAQKMGSPETREWWSVPVDGTAPRQLNWVRWAGEFHYFGNPNVLMSHGGITTLSRRPGENQQIYLVGFSAGDIATGEPVGITSGASWSAQASIAQGRMAFQSGNPEVALWRLPADTRQGKVAGTIERLNEDRAVAQRPSATADGRLLVYSSNRTGSMNITMRELASGREEVLTTESPEKTKSGAVIDERGTKVLYSINRTEDITQWDVYEITLPGRTRRKVCDRCGPTHSLSPDGKYALASRDEGARSHIAIIDVATGATTPLLQHASAPVSQARISPDGRWVAFIVGEGPTTSRPRIAPMRVTGPIPESEWISLTESTDVRQVFWSPTSSLIYYDSTVLGVTSLMAQRLDAARPSGPPLRIYDFGRVRPTGLSGLGQGGMVAVDGAIIGAMQEINFNIWITNLPTRLLGSGTAP